MILHIILLGGLFFVRQKWAKILFALGIVFYVVALFKGLVDVPNFAKNKILAIEVKNFFLTLTILAVIWVVRNKIKNKEFLKNKTQKKDPDSEDSYFKQSYTNFKKSYSKENLAQIFCVTCGKENDAEAKFCKHCGAKCVKEAKSTNTAKFESGVNVFIILHCIAFVVIGIFFAFLLNDNINEGFTGNIKLGISIIAFCIGFCYIAYEYLKRDKIYTYYAFIIMFGMFGCICVFMTIFNEYLFFIPAVIYFVATWHFYEKLKLLKARLTSFKR